jgi:hypothetical protein
MKLPSPPSASELATPHYDEFCEIAQGYFDTIDRTELVNSITLDDLRRGVWRAYGFAAIHELPADEKSDRQLRVHVRPGIAVADIEQYTTYHKHGAHLGGLAVLRSYTERLANVYPSANDQDDLYTSYELQDGVWVPKETVTVTEKAVDVYEEGSAHFIDAADYHKTPDEPGPLAITVVVRGKVRGPEGFLQPADLVSPLVFPPISPMSDETIDHVWTQLNELRGA